MHTGNSMEMWKDLGVTVRDSILRWQSNSLTPSERPTSMTRHKIDLSCQVPATIDLLLSSDNTTVTFIRHFIHQRKESKHWVMT